MKFEQMFGQNGDMDETLPDGREMIRRLPHYPCVECGHFTPWRLRSPYPIRINVCSTECLAAYDAKRPATAAPATDDPVNAPSHYTAGGIEVIDTPSYYDYAIKPHEAAEIWGLDRDAYLFCVLKYIIRAGKKESEPAIRDLRKARDYINLRIAQIERQANA